MREGVEGGGIYDRAGVVYFKGSQGGMVDER